MAVNPQISTDLSIAQPNAGYQVEFSNPNAKTMRPGVGEAQRADVRQAQDAIAGMGGMQNLQFPNDAPKYWMGLTLSEYSWSMGNGGGAINTGNVLGAIRLPVPTQLEDVQRIEYDQTFQFGPLWGGLTSAAVGLAGGDATAWDTARDTVGAVAIGGGRAVGGPVGTAAGGAQAYYGLAPNQFFTVLLKGPQFKTYSLDFVLQPRTEAESTTIRDIIQVLRWAAAPDLTAGGALWKFPTVVTPTFVPQGNGNETYMYRFKPAVMTDVGAAYNPFGPPSFYRGTGAPESVRLTIHFLELEYWLKRDFE